MSFFRKDAVAVVTRWQGIVLAGAVALVSVSAAARGVRTGDMVQAGIGGLVAAGSIMAGLAMFQRARLQRHGEHFGEVEVDEGEIRVWGPEGWAILSLDVLDRVEVRSSEGLGVCWVLYRSKTGLVPVIIPLTAKGSDALFDALSSLPGIDLSRLVDMSVSPPARTVAIWKRKRRMDRGDRIDSIGENGT